MHPKVIRDLQIARAAIDIALSGIAKQENKKPKQQDTGVADRLKRLNRKRNINQPK